jgi:hypothetical protein
MRREQAARVLDVWLKDSSQARLPSGFTRVERTQPASALSSG